MQLRNTTFQKLFLKQSKSYSPCNSATLLKKNICPNLSLSRKAEKVVATAQHCFPKTFSEAVWILISMQQRNTAWKKKYVWFWALAKKLRKWSQLRNTAFYKLFLKQSEFKSPCNSATLLDKNRSPNLSLSRKAERVLATAQHCFPQTFS